MPYWRERWLCFVSYRHHITNYYYRQTKADVSSTINAVKTITNLGSSLHGVFLQTREKIDKLQKLMISKKCVFRPISQIFLLVDPSVQFFGHNVHYVYHLSFGGCGLPKIFGYWKYDSTLLAHVYYGITAGWIRIPLGTEVRLGPGDIVLDGDPPPHAKGHSSPHFSAYCSPASPQARILSITGIVD